MKPTEKLKNTTALPRRLLPRQRCRILSFLWKLMSFLLVRFKVYWDFLNIFSSLLCSPSRQCLRKPCIHTFARTTAYRWKILDIYVTKNMLLEFSQTLTNLENAWEIVKIYSQKSPYWSGLANEWELFF